MHLHCLRPNKHDRQASDRQIDRHVEDGSAFKTSRGDYSRYKNMMMMMMMMMIVIIIIITTIIIIIIITIMMMMMKIIIIIK